MAAGRRSKTSECHLAVNALHGGFVMIVVQTVRLAIFISLLCLPCLQAQKATRICDYTRPPSPAFVPPPPFRNSQPDRFYFGNDELWVSLWKHSWGGVLTTQGLRVKFPWFSAHIEADERTNAKIAVSGRRIDA